MTWRRENRVLTCLLYRLLPSSVVGERVPRLLTSDIHTCTHVKMEVVATYQLNTYSKLSQHICRAIIVVYVELRLEVLGLDPIYNNLPSWLLLATRKSWRMATPSFSIRCACGHI